MKWQILIATTTDRRPLFDILLKEFEKQILECSLSEDVEILYDEDNREKSIGAKRQALLLLSSAEYVNSFDSDDMPYEYYVKDIYEALMAGSDCVGMIINMTTNLTNTQTCCHSMRYKKWENKKDGYDYVRNVTHFNPVLRSLAIQVGFPDLRYGEDIVYSDQVTKLCKTETFIEKPLFHYRYSTLMQHNEKYGIK